MSKSFIGKILKSFIEDEVREISIEVYEGYTQESRQVLPPGIDANPLPDDQGFGMEIGKSNGKDVQFGIIYDKPLVENGEIKIFGRDSSGNIVSSVYCKKDGNIEVNGGSKNAARKDDAISSTSTEDSVFWTWIAAVHAALQSSPANGVVAVAAPTSITGKITEGTTEVLLP